MNNLLIKTFSLLSFVISIILVILFFTREEKLAYIDNPKLAAKYLGALDARKELEKKTEVWQANVDTLVKEFESTLKKYEQDRITMGEKERKLQEQLLGEKQKQLSQYRDAMGEKVKEENTKLSASVIAKLNDYIKRYGKEKKYRFIFGANDSGNIVYADEMTDITDEIIEGVNKEYKSK